MVQITKSLTNSEEKDNIRNVDLFDIDLLAPVTIKSSVS